MVEFLTGSTRFIDLLSNLFDLLVFVFITVPNYALSAILIREALVAWRKNWASLLSLSIAYGAVNEGLTAKTYFTFQPFSPALGTVTGVGRLFGINWPWVTGITLFHMIVSMSVPVALSFLILSDVASQRLLGRRGTNTALGLLVLQIALWTPILLILDPGLHQVLPLLALPIAIVLVFTYFARRLPAPDAARKLQGFFGRPRTLAVAAFVFFLLTFAPILRLFAFPFISTSFVTNQSSNGLVSANLNVFPYNLPSSGMLYLGLYQNGKLVANSTYNLGQSVAHPPTLICIIRSESGTTLGSFTPSLAGYSVTTFLHNPLPSGHNHHGHCLRIKTYLGAD